MPVTSASPPLKPLAPAVRAGITREERRVIFASSLGTVFEWYDFYLYGSLAAIISRQFFSGVDPTTGFIFALLAFAAGFAVRPFGAIVFGRLGDLIGRKYTFLLTILIMGISTAIVGFLPSYASIGVAAPVILISARLLQGLALGGEYGGAATYVAEHAPPGRRGNFTAWIQTTATLGLFLSLLIILVSRSSLGNERFEAWGWRIPFLLSVVLLAVSVCIRLQLQESPVFRRMKEEGKSSRAPLTESFLRWGNLKIVLLVLFGGVAGQAVVWYTGQFYALFFLLQTLKVDPQWANYLIAASLLIGTPFFIVFGTLSDRIGGATIILAGCLLSAITYFPIFHAITRYANPALETAQEKNPITVVADPKDCSFQFDPIGKASFTGSCDVAKSFLAKKGYPYRNEEAPAGTVASIRIGSTILPSFAGKEPARRRVQDPSRRVREGGQRGRHRRRLPGQGRPKAMNKPMVVLFLAILVLYVTMVYGPMAAWLVELFPARIRYTSMSLPYHIGNGWFGGFLPPSPSPWWPRAETSTSASGTRLRWR